ncbi:NCS2 family permease [Helicobacter ailurogastricus]|uniref:Xanthine/uracil/thiamine/ascorbate permease family protein n=2 Tax=Helicobacter ailurogastricus TaxID=1578720 RepID=A0A0K2X8V7_9HELI|nr:NCS2 family permease [Helicobacter ailurogastricus]CRF41154.1 Xanthine/uracil/thiamine/ascorbate permease family protein [Helicobacter ailurogastricus]CRF42238.1 Xanthine/uracil/thiamine/ascorbate permease family protein [Helicobacter ailurogastricus]
MLAFLSKFFQFKERNTSLGIETLAGLTTFVTISYIAIVNPSVLQKASMDFNGVFVATLIVTIVGTLIMGIVANYPIAIAPSMGMNAYFTFVLVLGMGMSWRTALGSVFWASLIFLILSLTGFREALIKAIPTSLKAGITAGIGLFIAFIGMQNAHLVEPSSATIITLGNFSRPIAYMSLIGLFITIVLLVNRVKAAIFLGILITALLALLLGHLKLPDHLFELPKHMESTFFKLDILGALKPDLGAVIFTFFLVMLFDTTATMIGVAQQANLMRGNRFLNAKSALSADAIASAVGAMVGTSPTSTYIESGAGVSVGGRTGFTCVVVALLFAALIFLAPLAKALASVPAITSPALIIVGFMMMSHLSEIDWHDLEEALPAFFVLFWIPISYSITNGVGIGLIIYPLIKICRGKFKQVHPLLYLFGALFVVQFVIDMHG